MSSYLSSRAAACGFNLEHMVKWPSCTTTTITTTTSNSSSPSSTLSESTNSPILISTRKPRKPRKRPNQTYNEAAALLSMACPNIFTTKHLTKPTISLQKITKQNHSFFDKPPELIENPKLQQRMITKKPFSLIGSKVANSTRKPGDYLELSDNDFETESILDEEIEQGIDGIMGELNLIPENIGFEFENSCYGYPFEVRNGVRALRNDNEEKWWCSPMVDLLNISQAEKTPVGKINKNTKKKKKKVSELMKSESEIEDLGVGNGRRLMLKLDYDGVMNAWTNKGLPVPEEISSSTCPGGDIHAKAANIDLFSINGEWSSESSVTRSMDKNHFKKIRSHQVKNDSSDRRPRCKGRFVKNPSSSVCFEET